jgi:hypothetical protein
VRRAPGKYCQASELGAPARPTARRDTHHPSQDPADVAEIQVGVEVLQQLEDVALGLAERIPPASSVVVDDQGLATGNYCMLTESQKNTLRYGDRSAVAK